MATLWRYFDQHEDRDGRPLFWSTNALDGLPFRGKQGMRAAPLLKQQELDEQVQIAKDFRVQVFDLSNADQLKEYEQVMTCVANGWFILFHVERDGLKRTVEWIERYGEMSPDLTNRLSGANGHSVPVRR